MRSLNRIRVGRYYPLPSPVHRLDPRVKIAASLGLIACAFLVSRPLGLAFLVLFVLFVVYLAKLPPLQLLGSLRTVMFLLLITALAQLFFSPGRELWRWGCLSITNTGLRNGLFYTVRLVMAVIILSALTMCTNSLELLTGFEGILRPLQKIRFPVHETAMVLTNALTFLPLLIGRAAEIAAVQEARGADFSSGNILRRARSLLPLLLPMFVSCFHDADDMGTALASRGYRGGRHRSRWKHPRLRGRDFAALLTTAAAVVFSLLFPW